MTVVNKELDDEFGATNHRGGADLTCHYEGNAHGRECGLFIRWAEEKDLAKYQWTQV